MPRVKLTMRGLALASVLSILAATPTLAHSFDVDIVFPQSATAAARDNFVREFRRASAERDSHAGEESDGHLGGLDVYSNVTELNGGDQSLTGIVVVVADGEICHPVVAAVGIQRDLGFRFRPRGGAGLFAPRAV